MIAFDITVNNQRIGRIECVNVGPTTDGCHSYEVRLKTLATEGMRWMRFMTRATAHVSHRYTDGWHVLFARSMEVFERHIQNDWDRRKK